MQVVCLSSSSLTIYGWAQAVQTVRWIRPQFSGPIFQLQTAQGSVYYVSSLMGLSCLDASAFGHAAQRCTGLAQLVTLRRFFKKNDRSTPGTRDGGVVLNDDLPGSPGNMSVVAELCSITYIYCLKKNHVHIHFDIQT